VHAAIHGQIDRWASSSCSDRVFCPKRSFAVDFLTRRGGLICRSVGKTMSAFGGLWWSFPLFRNADQKLVVPEANVIAVLEVRSHGYLPYLPIEPGSV